jgi:hypothetical protein
LGMWREWKDMWGCGFVWIGVEASACKKKVTRKAILE